MYILRNQDFVIAFLIFLHIFFDCKLVKNGENIWQIQNFLRTVYILTLIYFILYFGQFCFSMGVHLFFLTLTRYLIDVLWGQPIQLIPSFFYFRISWILMEQHCFYFFCPLGFLRGLRSLKHWLLQKLSMKNLDQKFKFLIKKKVFWCSNIFKTWIVWPLKIQL